MSQSLEFTCFLDLPKELQIEKWKFAAENAESFFEIMCGILELRRDEMLLGLGFWPGQPLFALLGTCLLSRKLVLEWWIVKLEKDARVLGTLRWLAKQHLLSVLRRLLGNRTRDEANLGWMAEFAGLYLN